MEACSRDWGLTEDTFQRRSRPTVHDSMAEAIALR